MLRSAWILAQKDIRTFVRDKTALTLSVLVPIALVTVFGWIMAYAFGGGSGGMPKVTLHVFNDDGSQSSRQFVEQLKKVDMVRVIPIEATGTNLDMQTQLQELIRNGEAHHILVLPAEFSTALAAGDTPPFNMLRDPGRKMEDQIVQLAIVQASVAQFGGDLFVGSVDRLLTRQGMNPLQVNLVRSWMTNIGDTIEDFASEQSMDEEADKSTDASGPADSESVQKADAVGSEVNAAIDGEVMGATSPPTPVTDGGVDVGGMLNFVREMLPIETTDVAPPDRAKQATYQQAQSVAGMSVMMLLFALTSCGSVLLKEREDGTLKRLFSQPISRTAILLGKFFFVFAIGCVQLTILFLYGEWMFRVGLFRDPVTLLVLSLTWVATGGAFGVFLAAFSRTSKQAEGLASLLILVMAALGGCWFPLQMMDLPPLLEGVCKSTMTYWAMSGYQGMLWNQLAWTEPKMLIALAWQWSWCLLFVALAIFFFRRNYCRG